MIPIAHTDQVEAACREVHLYVARLAADPPLGTKVVEGDQDVNDALWYRLKADLEDKNIQHCCARAFTPRPLYWLPRYNALLCDAHWNLGGYCMCFKECDACSRPIEEASVVFMFMNMYIVQAILCLECEARVRLSPAGG